MANECIFKNETIIFPITYELKLIVSTDIPTVITKDGIELIFNDLKIPFTFIQEKESAKGNYSSITYRITLIDKAQMDLLYFKLNSLPALKMAI